MGSQSDSQQGATVTSISGGVRKDLTKRQAAVLEFIQESIDERGYPPTIREIGNRLSIRSTNGVNDHLKALERKGYLRRAGMKSRAMRPVDPPHSDVPTASFDDDRMVEIPVLGRVAAGLPILAVEEAEDTVRVDRLLLGNGKEVFALTVVGESMIEDGIFDGDYIFVKKQVTASRGDIVVALIGDEATCKRYYPEGNRIRFQPGNSSMAPIYVHRDDFKNTMILGVVVGVYRRL